MNTAKHELTKTKEYRKVMKPILERKRRARINKSLDELKDLIAERTHQNGDKNFKLEKADILELTVQHLRKIKKSKPTSDLKECFRNGYIQAANEISQRLGELPQIDVTTGVNLMAQLGARLNILVPQEAPDAPKINIPLNVHCGNSRGRGPLEKFDQHSMMIISPVSSGYRSDSDLSMSSSSSSSSFLSSETLLRVSAQPVIANVNTVWRPW